MDGSRSHGNGQDHPRRMLWNVHRHKRKTVFKVEGNPQRNARNVSGERDVLKVKRDESINKCQVQLMPLKNKDDFPEE